MKAVVLFSGGLDSTVLVQQLIHDQASVRLLSINYGQRHKKELSHSSRIATSMNLPHRILDLPDLAELLSGSSLTDSSVELPEGHYAEESMKSTVVPNRNMILLSLATGYAVTVGAGAVWYGAHGGDHAIYPDCRPGFAEAMDKAVSLGNEGFAPDHFGLITPFIEVSKTEIARIGDELGVPWVETWSCYKGGEVHCGTCGTCVERREAFREAGVHDPTEYLATLEFGDGQ